jgi:bacterioferritin
MDPELSIQTLQAYATGLAAQSLQHKVQGMVFGSRGFSKLASKYAVHATEEMEWVDKFIDRIIDLGGEAKVEAAPAMKVYTDPVEFLKADLEVSVREVPILGKATLAVCEDMTTYDLLKGYYQDEEEDMAWSDQQLKLIECIGLQNWLIQQL